MGIHLRQTLIKARRRGEARLTQVAAVTAADTIYQIDRISEEAIVEWFEAHWPAAWPVQVVMEGVEEDEPLTFPLGTPVGSTRLKCILDPIDGTRNLMYDKRPAWGLAGIAVQRGEKTNLQNVFVAVMTELPTSNQGTVEQWSGILDRSERRGAASTFGTAVELHSGQTWKIAPRPSQADHCRHGFASLVKFFPEGKELTARIEERLWRELYGDDKGQGPLVFEDQYTTTGGQIHELLVGHDRFIGDLRPLVNRKLGVTSALVCHPYDICTELILRAAGGVVEHPLGGPVRVPLDTISPVAWVGYANQRLARKIRPVLRRILAAEDIV
ncbi:MAG TPA: inositol monophosphatase [Opitutaceae bacterium]